MTNDKINNLISKLNMLKSTSNSNKIKTSEVKQEVLFEESKDEDVNVESFIDFEEAEKTTQNIRQYTTCAVGEEGGGTIVTASEEESGDYTKKDIPDIKDIDTPKDILVTDSYSEDGMNTTCAVGEEGGSTITTCAVGEEGGGTVITTSEEENGIGQKYITCAIGEDGSGNDMNTTCAVGEEGVENNNEIKTKLTEKTNKVKEKTSNNIKNKISQILTSKLKSIFSKWLN